MIRIFSIKFTKHSNKNYIVYISIIVFYISSNCILHIFITIFFSMKSDRRYYSALEKWGCYLKLIRKIHTLCHVCSVHLAHWKRFLYIICVRICICICKEYALYLCMYHDHVHMRILRELLSVKKKARDSIYFIILSRVIMSLVKIKNIVVACLIFLEYLTED